MHGDLRKNGGRPWLWLAQPDAAKVVIVLGGDCIVFDRRMCVFPLVGGMGLEDQPMDGPSK